MTYFLNPEVALGPKLLECIYIVIGLLSIYNGIKNFRDETNEKRIGTAIFWCLLGVVIGFGRWIPPIVNGILIVLMTIPSMIKQTGKGAPKKVDANVSKQMSEKLGMKIFIPAFTIGVSAIIVALFTKLGALVGVGIGVFIAIIILMVLAPNNKPKVFLDDAAGLLDIVGPFSVLPMLLASLGSVFTAAGVGTVISNIVGKVIPTGNVTVGIIVYCIGMALFTMIMGNAFAAITVMTVGIGAPFVLAYGADPVVVGMVALTCGFCGTLCTPMAANFNLVPVAMLEMKDRNGVIKNQVLIAAIMLTFQIVYMIVMS